MSHDLDELFSTPPDRFVAARDALAKRLPEVKAMRRPTEVVWLLNMLALKSGKALDALFAAGDELRAAQQKVLEGAPPQTMHDANRHARDALARTVDVAREHLAAHSRKESPAVTKALSSILREASVDPATRDAVKSGRLLTEPANDEESFLDALASSAPAKVKGSVKEKKAEPSSAAAKKAAAEKAAAEKEALEREARRARIAALDAALEKARAAEERAERAVESAERKVESAEEALATAKEHLAEVTADSTAARKERAAAEKARSEA